MQDARLQKNTKPIGKVSCINSGDTQNEWVLKEGKGVWRDTQNEWVLKEGKCVCVCVCVCVCMRACVRACLCVYVSEKLNRLQSKIKLMQVQKTSEQKCNSIFITFPVHVHVLCRKFKFGGVWTKLENKFCFFRRAFAKYLKQIYEIE